MILENASMHVKTSQVVLISGVSGIGKSSFLSLIGGFLYADRGEVKVFGHNVARMRSSSTSLLRRKLAFVPQNMDLIVECSALENVRVALDVCGVPRRSAVKRASEALVAVELGDVMQRRVRELSTGQCRRVCFARGLVRRAEIFVADEPSNDLDADRVLQMIGLVDDMRSAGTAVVMATNDPRLLAQVNQPGWRHLALGEGRLSSGDMAALFSVVARTDTPLKEERTSQARCFAKVVPFPRSTATGQK